LSAEHSEYERLIQPIEAQMLRSVWRVTRNADDAEDALQEALSVIWRRLRRIQKHPNPHALILRICLNAAYDVLRKKERRLRREQAALTSAASLAPPPSALLESRGRESAIYAAIGQLSRNQALAVTLRLVHGQSYDAIAGVLGCRGNTARKHVERGRERLCRLLAPLFPSFSKEGAR
jgi:RNA polymerase sigma-70 factor (ECF subfamily)